ncbi:ComEA family DNA-binding protein [Pseudofulvibacter geojedonensis]|uniref:ComEA family DNA-binding protein n=1 Tax=Pseudofulvibacter geojedonensis TaxID=1123758 RepID=UPI00366EF61C
MRNFNKIKSQFVFNKQQRIGVFLLLFVVVLLQLVYYYVDFSSNNNDELDVKELMAFQKEVDSLVHISRQNQQIIHPFNPNFISDYKGYALGMSVDEINRLHSFRKQNRYVNSVKEFQEVTQVSDSLLKEISSYFKFPDWVNKRGQIKKTNKSYNKNLNTAAAKDLIKALNLDYKKAYRLINFRDKLGGYLVIEQVKDVYGIKTSEYEGIRSKFQLKTLPKIQKINVNLAGAPKLASLVYISNSLAENIIDERLLRGGFKSLDELKFVEGFPEEKLERIKLYLTLN